MTIGDQIWANAIRELGVERLWADPVGGIAALGRIVIREIDRLDADHRTDLAAMELHYRRTES